MARNLMPEVYKLLGVERGETFKLHAMDCDVCENGLFAFTGYDELIKIFPAGDTEDANNKLSDILTGYYEIVRLPWEPKEGDVYYYPAVYSRKALRVTWHFNTHDYAMKALGMVYRTREEAEAHFAEDYEKLTGKKLNESA